VRVRWPWGKAAARAKKRTHYIRLRLRDVSQLFNSMDPSPFIQKDLDDDAEEFIVSWAREFPAGAHITLRIYLDQWPTDDPGRLIRTAVRNYFAYRARMASLDFKNLLSQGRTSLVIGLVFLSACLVISNVLLGNRATTGAEITRESLTIAGWVAMWRPMQIYLYDWWPLRRRTRLLRKLAHMPVEVVQREKASPGGRVLPPQPD
jgi:hypothetical protein